MVAGVPAEVAVSGVATAGWSLPTATTAMEMPAMEMPAMEMPAMARAAAAPMPIMLEPAGPLFRRDGRELGAGEPERTEAPCHTDGHAEQWQQPPAHAERHDEDDEDDDHDQDSDAAENEHATLEVVVDVGEERGSARDGDGGIVEGPAVQRVLDRGRALGQLVQRVFPVRIAAKMAWRLSGMKARRALRTTRPESGGVTSLPATSMVNPSLPNTRKRTHAGLSNVCPPAVPRRCTVTSASCWRSACAVGSGSRWMNRARISLATPLVVRSCVRSAT